jgi:hypothetical protein
METLSLGKLTFDSFLPYVTVQENSVSDYPWTIVDHISLTESEELQLNFITQRLQQEPTHLLNEATIWGRAIYPMLLLGETTGIRARAEVPLSAKYAKFQIAGIADGALGKTIGTRLVAPLLVVVEAKRGIEGTDPIPQLYGEMLAAAWLNWQANQQDPQVIFGCYTIADTWTFVRGEVGGCGADRPEMAIEYSPEYSQKHDMLKILRLLKSIVSPSFSGQTN